jgi:hypothetical protein
MFRLARYALMSVVLCLPTLVHAHDGTEEPGTCEPLCPQESSNPSCTPGVCGRWTTTSTVLPFPVAHGTLLRNGWVLLMPETFTSPPNAATIIWNPQTYEWRYTGNFPSPDPTQTLTTFCSGHVVLSDGRVLAVGGGDADPALTTSKAWLFDPQDPSSGANGSWTDTCAGCEGSQCSSCRMHYPRYYPTLLNLKAPYVLVASGWCDFYNPNNGCVEDTEYGGWWYPPRNEVFDETSNTFQEVLSPAASPGAADSCPGGVLPCRMAGTYPGLQRITNSKVLFTRTAFGHGTPEDGTKAAILDFTELSPTDKRAQWLEISDEMSHPDRSEGMSVQLYKRIAFPTGSQWTSRVAVFGGGRYEPCCTTQACLDSRTSVEWIDTTNLQTSSQWQEIQPHMRDPRLHAVAIVLPNERVLVFGGNEEGESLTPLCPYRSAELFDPAHFDDASKPAFSYAGRMAYPRGYHTVAVLLPTGAVMVTSGRVDTEGDRNVEIYEPPYMFVSRPTISSADSTLTPGTPYHVLTPDAAAIAKVKFVRPMSITHHTDTEQKVLDAPFSRSGHTLTVTIPTLPTGTPLTTGYWMVFLVNGSGGVSQAKFFRVLPGGPIIVP